MKSGSYQYRGSELPDDAKRSTAAGLCVVDLRGVVSKADLMEAIAVQLALPKWFGRNWDALSDALGDVDTPVLAFEYADALDQGVAEMLADVAKQSVNLGVIVICRTSRLGTLKAWPLKKGRQ